MSAEVILRGATVVDGTGAPARRADVAIEFGRIVAVSDDVGDHRGPATSEVDLDGLVLAPGFIDVHTHYDAQILWDRDVSPSSWHGVTSIVIGNCGFGLAPTRPADRGTILETLENVEGMSVAALQVGVAWDFETFPDYLAVLASEPSRVNVAALLGHTPLRHFVMGDAAAERAADPDEVAAMVAVATQARDAGAWGFATSKSPTHSGARGRPVPSRFAELDEVTALADVFGAVGRGVIQITPGPGLSTAEMAMLSTRTGLPVSWTALLTGRRRSPIEMLDETAAAGGDVWPQIVCRPIVMQVNLIDPFPFAVGSAAFREVLATDRADRALRYDDPDWRARARSEIEQGWAPLWAKTTVAESDAHADLVGGSSIAELAAARNVHPVDLVFDLARTDDLRTRFRVVLQNDDEDQLADLLRDERALLAVSDAGAHASQLCDSCFSTYLLGHWVRENSTLSLEQAVWRLTGHPAAVFGFADRGVVAPGAIADLVAFDPATVGTVEPLERVYDLPGGADRLIAASRGIEHVWVSGRPTRRDGEELPGARFGTLLRGGTV